MVYYRPIAQYIKPVRVVNLVFLSPTDQISLLFHSSSLQPQYLYLPSIYTGISVKVNEAYVKPHWIVFGMSGGVAVGQR